MRVLDIPLVHHGVLQGRINSLVPEEHLDLFDGHSLVNRTRCQRTPELMRMNLVQRNRPSELSQHHLNAAYL